MIEYEATYNTPSYGKDKEYCECEDCVGTGVIYGEGIEPECCGQFDKYGGCCNDPMPKRVAVPELCQRCEGTGTLEII